MANSADPELDLDLHCLQNRVYPGSAGQGLINVYVITKVYKNWSLERTKLATSRNII